MIERIYEHIKSLITLSEELTREVERHGSKRDVDVLSEVLGTLKARKVGEYVVIYYRNRYRCGFYVIGEDETTNRIFCRSLRLYRMNLDEITVRDVRNAMGYDYEVDEVSEISKGRYRVQGDLVMEVIKAFESTTDLIYDLCKLISVTNFINEIDNLLEIYETFVLSRRRLELVSLRLEAIYKSLKERLSEELREKFINVIEEPSVEDVEDLLKELIKEVRDSQVVREINTLLKALKYNKRELIKDLKELANEYGVSHLSKLKDIRLRSGDDLYALKELIKSIAEDEVTLSERGVKLTEELVESEAVYEVKFGRHTIKLIGSYVSDLHVSPHSFANSFILFREQEVVFEHPEHGVRRVRVPPCIVSFTTMR